MLHTILVSTRNFLTARPRNNIFAPEESESDQAALLYQRDRLTRIGLIDKLVARATRAISVIWLICMA